MRYEDSPTLILEDLANHNSFEAFSYFLRATSAHARAFVAAFLIHDENVREVLTAVYYKFWKYRHNLTESPADGFSFFIELIGEEMEYAKFDSVVSYDPVELVAFAGVSDYFEILTYHSMEEEDAGTCSLLDQYLEVRIAQLPPSQLAIFQLVALYNISEVATLLQLTEEIISEQYIKALISVFVDLELYRANEANRRFGD